VEPLTWRVRLADDNPSRLLPIALAALVAGAVGIALGHSIVFGIVGVAAIAASTSEYWLGVTCTLSPDGATVRAGPSVSAIAWPDVRRVIVNDAGVTLSPLPGDSRLTPFRGVYLRAGRMGTERLVRAIGEFGGDSVRRLV